MDGASVLSQEDFPVKVNDLRRSARRVVRIPTTVAGMSGLANGVVTNISETGCELQLITSFLPSQYLTLKVYPHDEIAGWQITLAKIRWIKRELIGVEFVRLSQMGKTKLQRLCSGQGVLASGD